MIPSSPDKQFATLGVFSHIGCPFPPFDNAFQKWEVPPMWKGRREGILLLERTGDMRLGVLTPAF
jgi:hypothetical protein